MKSTILEILYDSVELYDKTKLEKNNKYQELKSKLEKNEFIKNLSKEQKKLYDEYEQLDSEITAIYEKMSFTTGFKLGICIFNECYNENKNFFNKIEKIFEKVMKNR